MAPRISVGLQSQRGQQYQVERAGGVGVLVELQSVCSAVNGVGLQSQRVGLQSQREAISAVVDERAGGVGLGLVSGMQTLISVLLDSRVFRSLIMYSNFSTTGPTSGAGGNQNP